MDVAIADPPPIAELDTELDGRLGSLHELGLADAQRVVEIADVGKRRLAHADGADFVGFDQADRDCLTLELVRERRGCHPAGGSSAHHANTFDGPVSNLVRQSGSWR